jgi:twinkle protein
MLKFLAVKRGEGGKKIIRASKDSKPRLFGWQAIPPSARSVVITEGEIDALTVADWGHAALSVPSGVENMDWVEHDFEPLARFERIYVCTDADEPGHKCAAKIAERLGRARCYRVILPGFKDANEAHTSGKFLGPDFDEALANAKTLDPAELRNAGDYSDELWEELHPSSPDTLGTETPWTMPWRIRPGEVSVWTGWNGHGKSHLLNHVMLHDMAAGQKCLIASFEMPVAQSLAQIAAMVMARRPESRGQSDSCLQWLAPRLWLYDVCGVKLWRDFLPAFAYACQRYGITRIVIDSLVRVGVGEEDYEAQCQFVSALVAFAAEHKCHIHLVAHSRKAKDESVPPGKMDIRGAGAITDLVHNGWSVWRNKTKEAGLAKAMMEDKCPSADLVNRFDTSISCWKNRKTGVEPYRSLWLHPCGQFSDKLDTMARVYLP